MNCKHLPTGNRNRQAGFTIIELMIATVVLATILLMVTALMLNLGKLYYRGITQSSTQAASRAILNDLVEHVRTSSQFGLPAQATLPGNIKVYYFCVDGTRYTYILNQEMNTQITGFYTANHVLWRDILASPASCPGAANITQPNPDGVPFPVATAGTELMPGRSRLTNLSISPTKLNGTLVNGSYDINLEVAVGEDDQLCANDSSNDCTHQPSNPDSNLHSPNPINVLCRSQAGDQFCATSSLSTTVVQRINGS